MIFNFEASSATKLSTCVIEDQIITQTTPTVLFKSEVNYSTTWRFHDGCNDPCHRIILTRPTRRLRNATKPLSAIILLTTIFFLMSISKSRCHSIESHPRFHASSFISMIHIFRRVTGSVIPCCYFFYFFFLNAGSQPGRSRFGSNTTGTHRAELVKYRERGETF